MLVILRTFIGLSLVNSLQNGNLVQKESSRQRKLPI